MRRAAFSKTAHRALLYGERRWTFAGLDRAADRVARHLLDAGLRKGDRVAVYGRNSDAYLLAWLGCVRTGLVQDASQYPFSGSQIYSLDQLLDAMST